MERFRRLGVHRGAHRNGVWTVTNCAKQSGVSFVTGGADGVVNLWSLSSGPKAEDLNIGNDAEEKKPSVSDDASSPISLTSSMKHHALGVVSVVVASEGTVGASCSMDGTMKLWDVASPESETRSVMGLSGVATEVWGLAMSSDGSLVVSVGAGGAIQVIDAKDALCTELYRYGGADSEPKDLPMCLAATLSPDKKRLAVGAQDGTIRVFDVETGTPTTDKIEGHSGPVRSISFLPSDPSSVVTCADDGLVHYYDIDNSHLAISLRGHSGMVLCAAPSPCGKYVTTGSTDRTVRIWDRKLREQVFTASEHKESVWGAAYVADGKRIVTVGDDEAISVLDCEQADVVVS